MKVYGRKRKTKIPQQREYVICESKFHLSSFLISSLVLLFLSDMKFRLRIELFITNIYGLKTFAIPKAAAEAMAPMRAVSKALLNGLLPVK